jgi:hypothetical protein
MTASDFTSMPTPDANATPTSAAPVDLRKLGAPELTRLKELLGFAQGQDQILLWILVELVQLGHDAQDMKELMARMAVDLSTLQQADTDLKNEVVTAIQDWQAQLQAAGGDQDAINAVAADMESQVQALQAQDAANQQAVPPANPPAPSS